MTLFQNKYRVASARHPRHNYATNASYFVTILTAKRKPLFGEQGKDNIILNEVGIHAKQIWQQMPEQFPGITLDDFVFMPNHMHGILHIT